MLRQETGSDERDRTNSQRTERRRDVVAPRLRENVPFGAVLVAVTAMVAGFLLARRRDGDVNIQAADVTGTLTDVVSQVSEQVVPEQAGHAAGETDGHPSAEHRMTEAERERKREEAAALSAPTTRGMPMLGVGTYDDADYDECFQSVSQALELGYRHVDAIEQREAYYNETAVGDAVDGADIAREEVFVATKVHPDDLASNHVRFSVDESLDRLDTDYIDLLYVHWPTDEYDPVDTLEAFADLREEGLVENIGVSNFTVDLLEEAIEASPAPLFANQVEMHPLLPQKELREFCARDDVDVELVAYSPIARGDVEDVVELQAVADKYDATPEQVSLAWLREKGVTAIPRATNEDHLLENWLSLGLELDDEDVARLDSIEERRRIVDPDDAPWNQ